MKDLFNSLQSREKNLIIILIIIILTGSILSATTNLFSNLKTSSKILNSSKSDYNYVFSRAQDLSANLAQQSFELNTDAIYIKIDQMAINNELINYSRTADTSSLKIVYIMNDLEKSLMFVEESTALIGKSPVSLEVARLNDIKRYTLIFSL